MLCCVSLLKVGFQTADPADNLGNRISKGNFLIFLGLDALYCEHLVGTATAFSVNVAADFSAKVTLFNIVVNVCDRPIKRECELLQFTSFGKMHLP